MTAPLWISGPPTPAFGGASAGRLPTARTPPRGTQPRKGAQGTVACGRDPDIEPIGAVLREQGREGLGQVRRPNEVRSGGGETGHESRFLRLELLGRLGQQLCAAPARRQLPSGGDRRLRNGRSDGLTGRVAGVLSARPAEEGLNAGGAALLLQFLMKLSGAVTSLPPTTFQVCLKLSRTVRPWGRTWSGAPSAASQSVRRSGGSSPTPGQSAWAAPLDRADAGFPQCAPRGGAGWPAGSAPALSRKPPARLVVRPFRPSQRPCGPRAGSRGDADWPPSAERRQGCTTDATGHRPAAPVERPAGCRRRRRRPDRRRPPQRRDGGVAARPHCPPSGPGSRSSTRLRSKSTRMVPQRRPRRHAHSFTPTTRGGGYAAVGVARIRRSSVSPLTGMPRRRARCDPGSPLAARPMSRCARTRRGVRRALGRATSGRRSVKIRCRHVMTGQRNRRVVCPARADQRDGASRCCEHERTCGRTTGKRTCLPLACRREQCDPPLEETEKW
ncbi:hypothetical protein SAMN02982917_2276 [Azospirillum oryzae]|uniref:Uncharacterized protein n=1 Tax=Azospirillum oryzae TaxID=286727 RepID=A0A1X7F141_9PROT|nr:hypothetical protein SAMN02982917_2276 [Azospirillum oryzae]